MYILLINLSGMVRSGSVNGKLSPLDSVRTEVSCNSGEEGSNLRYAQIVGSRQCWILLSVVWDGVLGNGNRATSFERSR